MAKERPPIKVEMLFGTAGITADGQKMRKAMNARSQRFAKEITRRLGETAEVTCQPGNNIIVIYCHVSRKAAEALLSDIEDMVILPTHWEAANVKMAMEVFDHVALPHGVYQLPRTSDRRRKGDILPDIDSDF